MESSNNLKDKKSLENSLKLLVRSSSIVLIGLIISKISTYVYRIIIARKFGPESYGLFSLSTMLTGWVALFSILGLDKGIIRYISIFSNKKDIMKARCIFKYSIYTVSILSVLVSLILFSTSKYISISFFNEPKLIKFLIFFSLTIPLTTITSIFLSNLRSHKEISWNSFVSNIFSTSIKVVLIVLFIIIGFQLNAAIYSYLFGALITLLLAYVVGKKNTPEIFGKNNLNKSKSKILFKEVLSYSWPFLFVSITWRLFFLTDSFMIGLFKGVEAVGIYNSAVPLAIILTIPTEIFMQFLFPFINKEYFYGNKNLVNHVSKQVGKWIFALNLPILVLLIIFPEVIIKLLFGSEYIGASSSLILLSVGMLFFSIGDICNRLLAMAKRSKLILIDLIFMTLLNILLNLTFIPKFGYVGAALASMLSMLVFAIIFGIQSKLIVKIIPIKSKMINVLFSAITPTIFLFFVKNHINESVFSLIFVFMIYSSFYILFLIAFKAFDSNDKIIIDGLKKRFVLFLKNKFNHPS